MINTALKIFVAQSSKRIDLDFCDIATKMLVDKENELEIHLSHSNSQTVEEFSTEISEIRPDIYILCLTNESSSQIMTYAELAWNLDKKSQVIVVQDSLQNFKTLEKNLWSLGIREFLRLEMPIYEKIARFEKVLEEYLLTKKYQNMSRRLHQISLVDPLSGLSNMRNFYLNYTKMIAGLSKSKKSMAVFMIDLDKFKLVNDCNSHLFGSFVLSQVGRLMTHAPMLPQNGLTARYGGDEFIWALHVDSMAQAVDLADRWLKLLKSSCFRHDEYTASITASIGVALVTDEYEGGYQLPMKVADFMLYRAKRFGRDHIQGVVLSEIAGDIDSIMDEDVYTTKKSRLKKPA